MSGQVFRRRGCKLSHYLSYKTDGGIWLRNVIFADVVAQLLARAGDGEHQPAQAQDVERLAAMNNSGELWPGRCFDMAVDLLELEMPEFWAEQLYGLATDILTGRVGDEFEVDRKLSLIYGSYAWSNFFGLRAREEKRVN